MTETKFSCFWRGPDVGRNYRTAVSLHSHTNRSKESLTFLPQLADKCPMFQAALEKQCKKSNRPVVFERAYWTPPLSPRLAYETEKNQIENALGLGSLVSLTDHDNIEASTMLRTVGETAQFPISLEWSVPFGGMIFHLGVHNLPSGRACAIVTELRAFTHAPDDRRLCELLSMLDQIPDVLIIFNHPLWNQSFPGAQQDGQVLDRFLRLVIEFVHALEFNGTRGSKENKEVVQLAERWRRPLVSGGDRHGCEASGTLNLTRTENFPEFIGEIGQGRQSHVLLMPQYAEPVPIRTIRTLLDVIRNYPEFPIGSRRWDDRIFHPNDDTGFDQPISALWKAPPPYIEQIFAGIRMLEHAAVQRTVRRVFRGSTLSEISPEISPEAAS